MSHFYPLVSSVLQKSDSSKNGLIFRLKDAQIE
jgi:hypothetical protein